MENKKWRVAVIGCGFFANAQYFPYISTESNAECVAAVDIVYERAEEACKKFGIPNSYRNVYELLEGCDFDIAIDSASIQAHHEINMAILNAGKHLISQKPAAPNVELLTEQIEAAKKNNVKFACAPVHNMRYDLNFAKQLIEDGAIGNAYYAKCNSSHGGPEYFQYRDSDPEWFYEKGAGALVDMGVHGLQQVTYILGPAKRVSCVGAVTTPDREVRSGAYNGKIIKTANKSEKDLVFEIGSNSDLVLENVITDLKAEIVYTTAVEHDKAVALISHMPMVVAQALYKSVEGNELARKLASSGFRDMTRLALSSVDMADDMVSLNSKNIQDAILKLYSSLGDLTKSDYKVQIEEIKSSREKMYKDGKNVL